MCMCMYKARKAQSASRHTHVQSNKDGTKQRVFKHIHVDAKWGTRGGEKKQESRETQGAKQEQEQESEEEKMALALACVSSRTPLSQHKKKNGIEGLGVCGLASCFFEVRKQKTLVFFLRNSHTQTICTPYAGAEEEEGQEDLQF